MERTDALALMAVLGAQQGIFHAVIEKLENLSAKDLAF
jgi:hypothetical protein